MFTGIAWFLVIVMSVAVVGAILYYSGVGSANAAAALISKRSDSKERAEME